MSGLFLFCLPPRPLEPDVLEPPPSSKPIAPPKNPAFLLNAKAKGWRGEVHHQVSRYVPNERLFLSDTFEQANRTVTRLLQTDHDVIFTAGGDGSIVYLLNAIEALIRKGTITREAAPAVGVLRLGTGNALAHYLGSGEILKDLRALSEGAGLMLHHVNMLEGTGGQLFPSAGVGLDANILHDYGSVKALVKDTAFEPYVAGLGGYGAAIATRTLPKALLQPLATLRIVNTGPKAIRIDNQGRTLGTYEEGDVMYEGPARICGAASMPFWGFKIQMFPYADRFADFFQMRCYFGNVPGLLTNLRKFWKGIVREDKMFDVLAQSVHLESLGAPMPYQIAGDIFGVESDIHWQLAPHPTKLATVRPLK